MIDFWRVPLRMAVYNSEAEEECERDWARWGTCSKGKSERVRDGSNEMCAIQNIKSNKSSQAERHSPWFGLLNINTPSLDRTDASLLFLWGVVSRRYRHHGGSETTVALTWTERGNYDIGLNRTYQIVAEPTSKEMGADRPATSKTGTNHQGNVHEYFIYFSMAKCCISGFCRTSVWF